MKQWNGDEVNNANLNSTFGYDAVVDAAMNDDGAIYDSINDAIDAGHRNILVRPGVYTESVAIDQSTVRLTGARVPYSPGAEDITGGAIIHGQLDISSSCVEVSNLAVEDHSSYGVHVDRNASHVILRNCISNDNAGAAFVIEATNNVYLERCFAGWNAAGFYTRVDPDNDADHMSGITMYGCWAYYNLGSGFQIQANTQATHPQVVCSLFGCTARSNGRTATAAGIYLDNQNNTGWTQVIGCFSGWNGDSGYPSYGIRVTRANGTNVRAVIADNMVAGNYGAGIALDTASAKVILNGNVSRANSGGNYQNCASSPGYDLTGLTYGINIGN
jgi:hypothetical protein